MKPGTNWPILLSFLITIKLKIPGDSLNMIRSRQNSGMRKWLASLLVCALLIPSYSLYAIPGKQSADSGMPPCHQVQDQERTVSLDNSSKDCCDPLHQCDGNCDHQCSDCFSTGHLFVLSTFADEPLQSVISHGLPVSTFHLGLTPTLLLRPPCQLGWQNNLWLYRPCMRYFALPVRQSEIYVWLCHAWRSKKCRAQVTKNWVC